LRSQGLISERDYRKGVAAAEETRAYSDRETVVIGKIEQEQRARDRERDTRLRRLDTDVARLQGEIATHRAAMARRGHQVGRYVRRAPASGRIGQASESRTGMVIGTERLGAIIPESRIQVVAC